MKKIIKYLAIAAAVITVIVFLWHIVVWYNKVEASGRKVEQVSDEVEEMKIKQASFEIKHKNYDKMFESLDSSLKVMHVQLDAISAKEQKPLRMNSLLGIWHVEFSDGTKGKVSIRPVSADEVDLMGKDTKGVTIEGRGQVRGGIVIVPYVATDPNSAIEGHDRWDGTLYLISEGNDRLTGWFKNEYKEYDTLVATRTP